MARNNLTSKLRRGFYTGATAVALGIGSLLGCGDGPIEPTKDEMPRATTSYIAPTSGMRPLTVDVKYSCEDDKGISEYSIINGNETITKTSPIDTTLTYTESGTKDIKLECTDTAGQTASYGPVSIQVLEPPQPSFSHSATPVENSIDIRYSATMENLDDVKVRVLRDGIPADSFTVDTSPFTKTLTGNLIGNYQFAPEISGMKPDTAAAIIPDYDAVVNLSALPGNMNEGEETTINLESILEKADPNIEDNPLTLESATPRDGKTGTIINGYDLTIKSVNNSTGDYVIDLGFKNQRGIETQASFQRYLYDLLDVSGTLEDSEAHFPQPGIVKIYREDSILLDSILVDGSGEFNKKLEQRVADISGDIFIQARRIENDIPTSYVRTIKVPAKDQGGLLMRVVPYDGLAENGIETPGAFYRHAAEVLSVNTLDNLPSPPPTDALIFKWDFGKDPTADYSFKEIIISKSNPNSEGSSFNKETADSIKSRILNPNDIGAWFNGRIKNSNQVNIVPEYIMQNTEADYGRIVVYPTVNIADAIAADHTGDGYLDIGIIRVPVNSNGELTNSWSALVHEVGHASGLPGHAWTLPYELTIMRKVAGLPDNLRFADRKLAKAIYEGSYLHGTGTTKGSMNGRLKLSDILGLNWIR